MNSDQRIVITGMGALSPLGHSCKETFDALVAGRSGISRVSLFDPSKLSCQVAGEVKDFDPGRYMDRKMARRIGRYAQLSIAATQEALAQSGLDLDQEDRSRISCMVSSAIGDYFKPSGKIFICSNVWFTPPWMPCYGSSLKTTD